MRTVYIYSVLVLLMHLMSPLLSLRIPSVKIRRERCVVQCQRDEFIDPLDNIEPTNTDKSGMEEYRKRERKQAQYDNDERSNIKEEESMKVFDEAQYVDTTSFEVERLQTLPTEYLKAIKFLVQQLLPRVAFGILVLHVMLLLPTLYYLKVMLKFSTVVPFLYLAPIVFLVPYVVCLLWEYELVRVPYIDNRVRQLIDTQTKEAKDLLRKKEEDLTIRINLQRREKSEYRDEDIKMDEKYDYGDNELYTLQTELALLRLLSKINADALATEVLNVKRLLFKQSERFGDKNNNNSGIDKGNSYGRIKNAKALLGQLSLQEKQSRGDKISVATSTFMEMAILDAGGDKEETLEALKQFQTDLNNMVAESEPLRLLDGAEKTTKDDAES